MVQRSQLIASGRCPQTAEAYEAAGQFEQALMEIGASLVAGAEPFELVQPGEGALDDPARLAQSGTVGDAASAINGLMPRFHSRRRYLSKS